uniref:Uncharacterized protein n=1 Tax=Oryza sativa subsp. japonica TaxID=39947 RepID=Q7EZ42_ORYSJ|nr:hypothetical protein [Oryza sativa Japonica Group]
MKMKKIVENDKRNRHDEDDDVGDPVNSTVATNDNDEDAHQHLHSRSTVKMAVELGAIAVADASLRGNKSCEVAAIEFAGAEDNKDEVVPP